MMRVIVEIHPHGSSADKRTIAEVDIANVSELAEVSSYAVTARLEGQASRHYRLHGHHRSDGWIPLVQRVIDRLSWARSTDEPPPKRSDG